MGQCRQPLFLIITVALVSMPDEENVKIMLRNANRISKLTKDILDVSRIESNTLKLQKQ